MGLPRYSVLRTISGAMYDGVPQNNRNLRSGAHLVLNPKSMILTTLCRSSRKMMFSNLMSRCTIFSECI